MNAPHPTAGEARQVAVLDIGTRAIRLDVAELGPGGTMRILESLQQAVPLGKEAFGTGHLDQASIEECVQILRGFRHVLREYGILQPHQIQAVATSSVREADNAEAFLDRIYIATGIAVNVLEDGEVEHLVYLAIDDLFAQEPWLRQGRALVVEAGGGSTRLLLMQEGYVTESAAFRLGTLRLREVVDELAVPAERRGALMDQHIQRTINQIHETVTARDVPRLVALAGDSETAMRQVLPPWTAATYTRLSLSAFTLAEALAAASPDELMRRYHLPPDEAETAGPALLIYDRIARAFHAQELLITNRSMRRGLLIKMAGAPAAAARFGEQLAHAALALGHKYRFDERHATHVAALAVRLFRELREEHGLNENYEMLLRTAAILHDIGTFVSTTAHHKHSMYLIMHSELFGLARRDTMLIALAARYHRRATPRATHPEYTGLDHETRLAVNKLAALLRVADALDRSHLQQVRDITCTREPQRFVITVTGVDDLPLERQALQDKGNLFAEVFGMEVVLRTTATPRGPRFEG